jgi:hypothetical protein
MKKKIMLIGLSIVLVLGVCGCGRGNRPNKTLYKQGLEVISLMEEMASSDTYLKLYSASSDIQDIVRTVGEGDFSEPKAVYKVAISEETLLALMEMTGSEETEGMSDTLKEYVQSRIKSTFVNQINARGGATTLAAAGICTGEKTFFNDELTESVIYLYTYESAVPVAISFVVGEDGTVSATGNFILYEDFNVDTEQDIKDSFEELSIEVEVDTVSK